MKFRSKLRRWVNRDSGVHYRVGNRPASVLECVGLLVFIGALVLWQLHVKVGISSIWALIAAGVGLPMSILGLRSDSNRPDA